jgi:serine protease AprX
MPTACRLNPNGTLRSSPPTAAEGFAGIAPGARVLNVKVGAVDGAVDATQMIAAIDRVVANRTTAGLNIKVLVLAYGASTPLTWRTDPLAHAVEVARRNGLVVVAAAGNDGTTKVDLASPALNQNIVAVGALDTRGSGNPADWAVASFASRGNAQRSPDILAPGVAIAALRVPGSLLDLRAPASSPGDRFIRGSGTSQAAAVAGGLTALLMQRFPAATPAEVKAMLMSAAVPVPGIKAYQGAGAVVADRLLLARPQPGIDRGPTAGEGLIEDDRIPGSLVIDGVPLSGETDVQGKAWSSVLWARSATKGQTWKGGTWRGTRWAGDGFDAQGWAVARWPKTWAGTPWPTSVWASATWDFSGLRWRSDGWSGLRWRGASWSSLAPTPAG